LKIRQKEIPSAAYAAQFNGMRTPDALNIDRKKKTEPQTHTKQRNPAFDVDSLKS
jgi:hypothetical protein